MVVAIDISDEMIAIARLCKNAEFEGESPRHSDALKSG
jgi:hypothetical protein